MRQGNHDCVVNRIEQKLNAVDGPRDFILARCPVHGNESNGWKGSEGSVDARRRTADLEVEAKDSVIVPGEVEESEFWIRAGSEDADMPPADSHRKPLSDKEREIIRKLIKSGAKWPRLRLLLELFRRGMAKTR